MTRNRYLFVEKFAVYAAAAVLAAAVYFAFAPRMLPADPTGPITPLATGGAAAEITLLSVFLAAGLAVSFGGAFVRPGSFSLVLLAGMAGVSMRSGMFRVLVWREGTSTTVWTEMLAELLLLAAVMLIIDFAAGIIRCRMTGRRWKFAALSSLLNDQQLATLAEDKLVLPERQLLWSREVLPCMAGENHFLSLLLLATGLKKLKSSHRALAVIALKQAGGFLFIGSAIGLVAAYVLAGSAVRGQLVFAAFGGFWLATAAAYHLYPVPASFPAWLLAVIAGVAYYVIAIFTSSGISPDHWEKLRNVFQILPADWMFAGGAGAMFGLWGADRSKETRIIEKLELEAEKAS